MDNATGSQQFQGLAYKTLQIKQKGGAKVEDYRNVRYSSQIYVILNLS